jgi:hypothetical protein
LEYHIDKYTHSEELNIYLGTWNVGATQFKEELNLLDWLIPNRQSSQTPDMYFIGLQEIVELNASNLLITSNALKVEFWKNNIKNNLDRIDK